MKPPPRRPLALALASTLASALVASCSTPPPPRAPRPSPPAAPTTSPVAPVAPASPALERDTTVAGGRFSYGLHLAPLPNLLYHLDCISGATICARVVFREFWATLGLDAGDEAALTTWKELRVRYGGEVRRADIAPPRLPLLGPTGVFDVPERQRVAGLVSRTPAAYEASMALLSTADDARALAVLLARFEPRFTAWWQARGFAAGSASFDQFSRLLADPFFDATIGNAARFYEAELPPGPALDLHLVVQPAATRRLTAAFQLDRYAIIEVPEGGKVEGVIDVVAHEAFHYFFGRTSPARRAALLDRVIASDDPSATASFGIVDEALATALGNGVVGRHYTEPEAFARKLARDDGLYANRKVGRLGRALLPAMPALLERGTVSSPEFLHTYLAAARTTYVDERPGPIDYLTALVLVADPRFADPGDRLVDAAHSGFPYLRQYPSLDVEARAFLAERPFVSAAFLLPAEGAKASAALDALSAPPRHKAALSALARHARGFVYAVSRTPKSYAFVFSAPDAATMGELVERFASLTTMREGALVELR